MGKYRAGAIERRAFLLGASGAGLLAAASGAHGGAHDQHEMAAAAASSPARARVRSYLFFNPMEAIDVEALVDTFIPADEVGPGALELDVAVYIDRQLAGAFGQGARRYMQGPFAEGTSQQGWQIAMTPAQLVRAGLADINALLQAERQVAFAELSPADRARLLGDIESGKIRLATVPTRLFFELFLSLVQEGYFGDPIHGGNRGLGSWKMIGFPGVAGMYADKVEPYRNRPYPVAPRSIEDLL